MYVMPKPPVVFVQHATEKKEKPQLALAGTQERNEVVEKHPKIMPLFAEPKEQRAPTIKNDKPINTELPEVQKLNVKPQLVEKQ